MNAIETRGLTHRFGAGARVLEGIALAVPTGSLYGFLGPNGAGKTTTLRLILGLLGRQAGSIALFGQALESDRGGILRRIGSSIESPSLYDQLTARENLRVWQLVYRCPAARIEDALRLVGLADTGGKRAEQFSLGMKQRLALAVALLHEPELLILDEPTNGLDPQGIIEMRDLLARLNRERGITILVSSHILAEVEKLVTHVGVIHRGRLRFQGTLAALMDRPAARGRARLDTDDNTRALALLAAEGVAARPVDGRLELPPLDAAALGALNRRLVLAGLSVHEIVTARVDLERVFLDLLEEEPC